MKFSPNGSPIPVVFAGKFHPEIRTGSLNRTVKEGRGVEKSDISSFKRQYLENGNRYDQRYY